MTQAFGNQAAALTYVAPGHAELRPISLPPMADGMVEIETRFSAISRGTERLVFNGQIPESEYGCMRAPFQSGDFPFPVVYGYAAVGTVCAGDEDLRGRPVFALSPHQTRARLPRDAVTLLPEALPPRRATLAANTETALNVIWDAGIGPGDRLAIVGGGVLGLLIAAIAAGIPGAVVTVVDTNTHRAVPAAALGANFAAPPDAPPDQDFVIHTSASEAGLATALRLAGFEATVVEASWFGTTQPHVPLGNAFHSRRLTLKASQVGEVPPGRRARWTRKRRLEMALKLLSDPKFDCLITNAVPFDDLPDHLSELFRNDSADLATVVRYG